VSRLRPRGRGDAFPPARVVADVDPADPAGRASRSLDPVRPDVMALAQPSDVEPLIGLVPGRVVRLGPRFTADLAWLPGDDAVAERRGDRLTGADSELAVLGGHARSVRPAASDMSQLAWRAFG
jgi:hypothetical protein